MANYFLYFALNAEIENNKIDIVILTRDLDGLLSESDKVEKRNKWFNQIEKGVLKQCIRFLIIYELEALILADINTFNNIYKIDHRPKGKPKFQKDPKGLLMKLSAHPKRTYHPSHAAEIFQQLNFQKIYKSHNGEISFQSFIDELEITLN